MGQELSADDRLRIQELVHTYAWALDTGDADRFVGVFAENGVLVWDAFEQPEQWHGHAELRAFAEDLRDLPSTAGRQHHVTNIVIEGAGDSARATSYVMVLLRQEDSPHPVTVMGWYEDEFTRGVSGWTISRRTIRDWAGPVLGRLAGQTGERVARPRPAMLDGIRRRPK